MERCPAREAALRVGGSSQADSSSNLNRMTDESGRARVSCGNCDMGLDEPPGVEIGARSPCIHCGSVARKHHVTISATVVARSKLVGKARGTARRRPFLEFVHGDDLHRNSGRWMRLWRLVDRRGNWYEEVVTDPLTNEEVHRTEESLRSHTGHGTARNSHRS